jgi:hypothetical protein
LGISQNPLRAADYSTIEALKALLVEEDAVTLTGVNKTINYFVEYIGIKNISSRVNP